MLLQQLCFPDSSVRFVLIMPILTTVLPRCCLLERFVKIIRCGYRGYHRSLFVPRPKLWQLVPTILTAPCCHAMVASIHPRSAGSRACSLAPHWDVGKETAATSVTWWWMRPELDPRRLHESKSKKSSGDGAGQVMTRQAGHDSFGPWCPWVILVEKKKRWLSGLAAVDFFFLIFAQGWCMIVRRVR